MFPPLFRGCRQQCRQVPGPPDCRLIPVPPNSFRQVCVPRTTQVCSTFCLRRCINLCFVIVNAPAPAPPTPANISRDLAAANRVWKQCGIGFVTKSITHITDANLADFNNTNMGPPCAGPPVPFTADETLLFMNRPAGCDPLDVVVFYVNSLSGGCSSRAGCHGLTLASGNLRNIAIINHPNPSVLAHELGHVLGLCHTTNPQSLMTSGVIPTVNPQLSSTDCSTAQQSPHLRGVCLILE